MRILSMSAFIFTAGVLSFLIIFSSNNFADEKESSSKEEIIKTDKEFSERSVKDGIAEAFIT